MNIDALASVLASPSPLPAPTASASPEAAANFAGLMSTPLAEPAAEPTALRSAVVQAFPPPAAPAGAYALGDRILDGLQGVQQSFGAKFAQVSQVLDTPNANVSDLLRLQLSMAQLGLQVELVGKAIGKSTQNLDQLVRMQ